MSYWTTKIRQRLWPDKSVAAALSALSEFDRVYGEQLAWSFVSLGVERRVYDLRQNMLDRAVLLSCEPRRLVLEMIARVAEREAIDGDHFVYRGVLSGWGCSLRAIAEAAIHDLAARRFIDDEQWAERLFHIDEQVSIGG